MKHLFIYTSLLLLSGFGFYACDSTTAPVDVLAERPTITNLSITPQNVQFLSTQDGVKDTTIVILIDATAINLLQDQTPIVIISDRFTNESLIEETLLPSDIESQFSIEIPIDTKTTFFEEFIATVTFDDEAGIGNYAQGIINLIGFSEFPPEILEIDNPEMVQRPGSGTQLYPFTAKVTDVEGQDTIEGVYVRIINPETGEVNSSPFKLYDDGNQGDDAVANDSVYTVTFPVDPGSQIQTFELLYYAVDRGGLVSDTTKSTFSIVE